MPSLVDRLNTLAQPPLNSEGRPSFFAYGWNGPLSAEPGEWDAVAARTKRYVDDHSTSIEPLNLWLLRNHAFCFLRFAARPFWSEGAEGLARTMERTAGDNDLGPMLADALEDSGCDRTELLDCLRASGSLHAPVGADAGPQQFAVEKSIELALALISDAGTPRA